MIQPRSRKGPTRPRGQSPQPCHPHDPWGHPSCDWQTCRSPLQQQQRSPPAAPPYPSPFPHPPCNRCLHSDSSSSSRRSLPSACHSNLHSNLLSSSSSSGPTWLPPICRCLAKMCTTPQRMTAASPHRLRLQTHPNPPSPTSLPCPPTAPSPRLATQRAATHMHTPTPTHTLHLNRTHTLRRHPPHAELPSLQPPLPRPEGASVRAGVSSLCSGRPLRCHVGPRTACPSLASPERRRRLQRWTWHCRPPPPTTRTTLTANTLHPTTHVRMSRCSRRHPRRPLPRRRRWQRWAPPSLSACLPQGCAVQRRRKAPLTAPPRCPLPPSHGRLWIRRSR